MKKRYKQLMLIVTACLGFNSAYAGSYQGYVVNVWADGGKVLIILANGSGSATCSTGPKFYLDPNVAYDRAMLSLAIAAKMSDKLVWVSGSDNCQSEWPYSSSQQLSSIDLIG